MRIAPAQNMMVPGDVDIPILGCKMKCANCIHFRHRAVFKNSLGSAVPCSSPTIGRLPTSNPCMEFSPSSMELLQDTPKVLLRQLMKVLGKLSATERFKNRKEALYMAVIAYIADANYAETKKGMPLGSRVRVEDSDTEGRLLFLDKDIGIILTDEDVRVTLTDLSKIKLDVDFAAASDEQQEQEAVKAKPKRKAPAKKPTTKAKPGSMASNKAPEKKPTKSAKAKTSPKTPAKPLPKAKPKTKQAKAPTPIPTVKTRAPTRKAA